jgi:hypothetical protein|tara:strand:+ start:2247 stop:3020 length:774 start_codon:yes stop_codon:yes gene_type:complete
MLTVLSPAKKLSNECYSDTESPQPPQFLNQSEELVAQLKQMDPVDLMSLMGISENLATLNWERMKSWNKSFKPDNSREAVYSFQGDTYIGLDVETLGFDDLQFAQDNIRILSGLYGILRPLDLMMPYRLEMGTKLKNRLGNNLYEYWNDRLAHSFNKELKSHGRNIVINCASVEYFKSIDRPALGAKVITPQFKEIKEGKLRMISFFAKRARGMMARFIIQNRIENEKDILAFNLGGYTFDYSLSTPLEPVFTRPQA